jgi:N-methylhydantoinase A/oxoprolinase/acetone carboxylase beta subunit
MLMSSDAAILDLNIGVKRPIVAASKKATTPDVADGIQASIESALTSSSIPRDSVEAVVIGTTSFVNSLVERDINRLERVAVIRLCGVFTRLAPPFISFPYALRRILEGPVHFANGGLQVDGSEISEVSPQGVSRD